MTELARFRPAAARQQHPFAFERASLALFADRRRRILRLCHPATHLALEGEWRDPVPLRLDASLR